MSLTLDAHRWLLGPEGTRWLERVMAEPLSVPQWAGRLRKELSAQRTHLVLEQVELRARGRSKFAMAQRMFFTRKGLEQATDETIATYKARRFRGLATCADCGCGIGGDLLALAARGPAVGIERDPLSALLAEANLQACGSGDRSRVLADDLQRAFPPDCAAWHADPDRRAAGRRTTRIELGEPGVEVLDGLRRICPAAAIKLAPATDLPPDWATECEREWIGRERECRQQVAWFGQLAEHPGQRRATVLRPGDAAGSLAIRSIVGQADVEVPVAAAVGCYVFEPDAAILAAGLTGTLAAEHGLRAVACDIPYLTGDAPLADQALATFAVSDVLPFDLKRLRRILSARNVGRVEVKKRGVADDPEQVRRQLQLRGADEAVVLLAPIRGAVTAIVGRRTATTPAV